MASLPFHALKHGAEYIPDKAFEKIPFAGPRYFSPQDEKRRKNKNKNKKNRDISRERSPRDKRGSDSNSYSSEDESDIEQRGARRSYRRSDGRRRRRDRDDRDYESDQGLEPPRQYAEVPYFPPPPTVAVNAPPPDQQSRGVGDESQPGFVPRPYNPTEYGAHPGTRDDYYAGHPQEQQPFTPPPPQAGAYVPPPNKQNGTPGPPPSNADSARHSSIADRYRPAGYDSQGRGSPNPNYPSALTPYAYPEYAPPSYNSYQPPYSDRDDSPEPKHRRRSRSGSRKASRSRSRFGDRIKDGQTKAVDEFEKHKKELGVSALGALAGGIIGNTFSGKKNKNIGTFIGAALGGLGGGLYEKRNEDQRRRQKLERRKSRVDEGYESY
jgi:hypothetical protein